MDKSDIILLTGAGIVAYFLYRELMKGSRSAYNYLPQKTVVTGVRG